MLVKYEKGLQGPKGFLSNWFSINKKGNSRENFKLCFEGVNRDVLSGVGRH